MHPGSQHPRSARSGSAAADPGPAAPARGGGRDAFAELYEAHAGYVYGYLRARTPSAADAEELASRTFANALANLGAYRGRGPFRAWLTAIAHNLLANWYRGRGRRPPTAPLEEAFGVASDAPGPEAAFERSEETRRVRAAAAALAPDRRELIALKYADGLTNAEIGRRMGRSEGAIKALHHRTLRQLERALGSPRP